MLDERLTSATAPGQEPVSLDDDKLTYTLAEAASRLGISTWLAYEAAPRRAAGVSYRPPNPGAKGGAAPSSWAGPDVGF